MPYYLCRMLTFSPAVIHLPTLGWLMNPRLPHFAITKRAVPAKVQDPKSRGYENASGSRRRKMPAGFGPDRAEKKEPLLAPCYPRSAPFGERTSETAPSSTRSDSKPRGQTQRKQMPQRDKWAEERKENGRLSRERAERLRLACVQ